MLLDVKLSGLGNSLLPSCMMQCLDFLAPHSQCRYTCVRLLCLVFCYPRRIFCDKADRGTYSWTGPLPWQWLCTEGYIFRFGLISWMFLSPFSCWFHLVSLPELDAVFLMRAAECAHMARRAYSWIERGALQVEMIRNVVARGLAPFYHVCGTGSCLGLNDQGP